MDYLKRIIARVNRNGEFYAEETPIPLLSIPEFFEGNNVVGSIGCNLAEMPHPAELEAVFQTIQNRPDVFAVYIQITEMDDPDWPFSDTAWVITTATEAEIANCFPEHLAPDELWEGFFEDQVYEPIEIPPGYRVLACWWD